MNTYFESTVQYEKPLETGSQKKVTEHYIFDAMTFTEAEARTIVELTPFVSGDLFIKDIKRKQYESIIRNDNAEKWYDCKINQITLDEKTGAEKKVPMMLLVQAKNSDEASTAVSAFMHESLIEWEIHTIRETQLIDVFA